jgi:hypothetical protein
MPYLGITHAHLTLTAIVWDLFGISDFCVTVVGLDAAKAISMSVVMIVCIIYDILYIHPELIWN